MAKPVKENNRVSAKSHPLRKLEEKTQERLWYLAPKKGSDERDPQGVKLARALRKAATDREISNIPARWRSFVYFRQMTGRPSMSQLAYGMAQRPQSFTNYYSSYQFSGVQSRFMSSMADVFINRLLGHFTHISLIPANGTEEERRECQEWEEWVEGGFDQLDYWPKRTTMGTEAIWYGTGCLWFTEDDQDNPELIAINPDCVLLANPDDDRPYDIILRVWGRKTELLERYKNDPLACEAIANATSAYPAFYFGRSTLDCSDVVPYLVGYTRPLGKTPGRYVRAIGDYTLVDKDWEYPIPVEFFQHKQMPGSLFGQGVAELLLQVSQWIDGILNVMQEAEQRGGAGKWLIDENSNVNSDALGDTIAAAVTYLGKAPEYVTPEGIGEWSIKHLELLQNIGRSIVHVSEQAVKGEAPKGLSGVALDKYSEIDDQTYLEEIGRLEEFDRRSAYQLMMLGKRTKCAFIRKGSTDKIAWDELKFNPAFRINNIQAFNVGRLSQTVAGRIQQLQQMYAEGTIDKKLYIKYQQTPDIPGMFTELNGPVDAIQKQLDDLIKNDEYTPPSPWMDYDFAIATCESRMDTLIATKTSTEKGARDKQAALDRLSMWRATVKNLQAQNNTPPTTPGAPPMVNPGPPGASLPPGMGPAPGPFGLQPPPGLPGQGLPGAAGPGAAPPMAPPTLPLTNNSFAPA